MWKKPVFIGPLCKRGLNQSQGWNQVEAQLTAQNGPCWCVDFVLINVLFFYLVVSAFCRSFLFFCINTLNDLFHQRVLLLVVESHLIRRTLSVWFSFFSSSSCPDEVNWSHSSWSSFSVFLIIFSLLFFCSCMDMSPCVDTSPCRNQ